MSTPSIESELAECREQMRGFEERDPDTFSLFDSVTLLQLRLRAQSLEAQLNEQKNEEEQEESAAQ